MNPTVLDISDLSSGYGEAMVLRNISLSIRPGEIFALLGKNGMGKSTLLKTVLGFLPARRGKIKLFAEDVTALPTHLIARKAIAYMVYCIPEIDAATALANGLVSAVVPLAGLDAAVDTTLATMTARSSAALIAVKDYLRSAPMMEPRGAAAYGAALLSGVLTSAGQK